MRLYVISKRWINTTDRKEMWADVNADSGQCCCLDRQLDPVIAHPHSVVGGKPESAGEEPRVSNIGLNVVM